MSNECSYCLGKDSYVEKLQQENAIWKDTCDKLNAGFDKLFKENERLKKALEVAEGALMYMTEDYDCDPEDVALYDRRKALEALAQINKIKQGE